MGPNKHRFKTDTVGKMTGQKPAWRTGDDEQGNQGTDGNQRITLPGNHYGKKGHKRLAGIGAQGHHKADQRNRPPDRSENFFDGIDKAPAFYCAGLRDRNGFVKKNQYVNKGGKIGLIKLGSNVSLIIPKVNLLVKKGDKVKAGVTVIAKY